MLRPSRPIADELKLTLQPMVKTLHVTTSQTLKPRSTILSSPTPSSTSAVMSPGPIAAITVGSLLAALVAFFLIGTIINTFYMRKRSEETRRIEAQHRRWPDLESTYPSGDYFSQPVPNYRSVVEQQPTNYYIPPPPKLPKIEPVTDLGKRVVAIPPQKPITESPESYKSESSVARLIPAPKPAVVSNPPPQQVPIQRERPESTSTVFDEDEEPLPTEKPSAQPAAMANQPNSQGALGPNVGLTATTQSYRAFRPAPAKLQIPIDRSAPPPIIISPPSVVSKPSTAQPTVRKVQQVPAQSTPPRNIPLRTTPPKLTPPRSTPSRSTSSTPPNYEAFPTPPRSTNVTPEAPAKRPTPNLQKQLPPIQPEFSRKATPSYLPAYYTDPTPPAPFQLAPRSPHYPIQPTPTKNNSGSGKASENSKSQIEKASCMSDSGETSFESSKSEDTTPTEEESSYTKPLPVDPESPLKNVRYPKVPRSSNQHVPRSPPRRQNALHSRNASTLSNSTTGSGGGSSLLEKRRGQKTATELESSIVIKPPISRLQRPPDARPTVPRYHGQSQQPNFHQARPPPPQMQWSQRTSSKTVHDLKAPMRQPIPGPK